MAKPLPMDAQKTSPIWRGWKRGAPMANIARAVDWGGQTLDFMLSVRRELAAFRQFAQLAA